MSNEPSLQHSRSQTEELISQLQGIRITLIVGLIVLMIALAPWWLLGMGILMDEAGTGND